MLILSVALASQIHTRPIELAEATASAPIRIEATLLQLGPEGYQVEITKVVQDKRNDETKRVLPLPPKRLNIHRHATPVLYAMARVERTSGIRRSPILDQLKHAPTPVVGTSYCMLLRSFFESAMKPTHGFSLSVIDGFTEGKCSATPPLKEPG